VDGTTIVFRRNNSDYSYEEIIRYDLGPDGLLGTGDDSETQMTDSELGDSAPHIKGDNIVWERTEEDNPVYSDVYITPVGSDAANIDQVRFTLNAPSGDKYTDLVASDVVDNTYTLHNPVLVNETGQWTIDSICEDIAGRSDTSQVQWDVADWPFSTNQKLSVYNGVVQIAQSSGVTLINAFIFHLA